MIYRFSNITAPISNFIRTTTCFLKKKFALQALSIAFLFLLCMIPEKISAQNYPVSVSTTITPPYSVYLADYIESGSSALQVNIVPTDQNLVNYQAKLHLVIESGSVTIETSSNYIPSALYLNSGVPEYLTGSDLAAYFDVDNLTFTGYSKSEYIRTGKLPEGIYRFSFYVEDYNRSKRISNIGGTTAWLILNDPPLLSLPLDGDTVDVWDPQSIVFQWTPRHKGSPNSSFTAEYTFRLYEVWVDGLSSAVVAQTQTPIYETTVSKSRLAYGVTETALIPGTRYVWTVQAQDTEERDLFKNDGLSDAYTFIYGEECLPPTSIEAEAINGPGIKLSWISGNGETGYETRHRLKDSEDEWYSDETILTYIKLYDVEYSEEYEYQIRSVCGSFYSEYSDLDYVATLIDVPESFECSSDDSTLEITNTEPQPSLATGAVITAGGFEAEITSVSGSDGTFSGTCLVTIPFLNYGKVPHSFEDIEINELNQMMSGKLEAIVNPDSPFLVDLSSSDSTSTTDSTSSSSSSTDTTSTTTSTVSIEGTIDSVYTTDDGSIVVTTEDGTTTTFTQNDDGTYTYTDENGESQTVSADDLVITDDSGNSYTASDTSSGSSSGSSDSSTSNSSETISADFSFGPVSIEFTDDISQTSDGESNTANAKIEVNVGESSSSESFTQEISLTYKTNTDGDISFIDINVDDLDQEMPSLFGISSTIESIAITYDNTTGTAAYSGSVDFSVDLDDAVSFYNGFVVLKEGINGDFQFDFESSGSGYSADFDYSNIQGINIDIIKDSKSLASLSNGSLNSDGVLTTDISLGSSISYENNGFDISLTELSANIDYDFINSELTLNTIEGAASVNSIPGISTSLSLEFEKTDDEIVAEIQNLSNVEVFGLSLSAQSLKAEFDENFDLQVFTAEDVTASFTQTGASGTITIDKLVVEDNALKSIEGSGSFSYGDYGTISLTDAYYSSTNNQIIFDATVSVSASGASGTVSVDQVKINEDGSIELGEISADLQFESGPLSIEFSSEPDNNTNRTKTVSARVSLEASEGDLGKTITYETTVSYKSDRNLGFTYLNVDASDLDIEFPELYGIESTVNSVNFEYNKSDEGVESFAGSVTLSASLNENKSIYSDIVILEKGLNGNIVLNYSQDGDDVSGSFDFTAIKGLKISYMKGKKKLATLSGSLNSNSVLSGKFVLNDNIEFATSGFTAMLTSFDVNAKYNLKTEDFSFVSGKAKAKVYGITGVKGKFLVTLDYAKDNFTASVESGSTSIYVCDMLVKNLDLSIVADEEWNITKIDGNFALKHDDFNTAITVNTVLIENGALTSFSGSANVKYKDFDFKLSGVQYKNSAFKCDASVKLKSSGTGGYFAVDDFAVDSTGSISVGGISGKMSTSVMAISFNATFGESKFDGTFSAKLASKIGMDGEVHMGSSECGSSCSGYYPYGYYSLNVQATFPVFPGINITSLGGRFGYNYAYDFTNVSSPTGSPNYGTYLAGLSLGVSDVSKTVNLAVNPAMVQWGGETTTIALSGSLKIPATNPMVSATADVVLNLPSYDMTGRFAATVNVPAVKTGLIKKGFIFNSSGSLDFTLNDSERSFSGTLTNATLLNALNFSGSFLNKRLYDDDGNQTSFVGELDGNMSFTTGFDFSTSGVGYSIAADFNLSFSARCDVDYSSTGLNSGSFDGRLQSSGSINATIIGCDFSPSYSLDAAADLDYYSSEDIWKLTSSLAITFQVDEDSKERTFNASFEHEF